MPASVSAARFYDLSARNIPLWAVARSVKERLFFSECEWWTGPFFVGASAVRIDRDGQKEKARATLSSSQGGPDIQEASGKRRWTSAMERSGHWPPPSGRYLSYTSGFRPVM